MSNTLVNLVAQDPAVPAVVVVGAINVDLVVAAPRLPGPGETVVGPTMVRHGGGKGANAAVAAARAGARVHLIGAVGADDTGRSAVSELQDEGIDVDGVAVLDDQTTGVALIVIDPLGENQIAVGAGANAAVTAEHVRSSLGPLLGTAGCVLVSTEIPTAVVGAAVRAAIAAGVRCVLNPAPVATELFELLTAGVILTPNETELVDLARLLGIPIPMRDAHASVGSLEDVSEVALDVVRRTGADVIVTLGAAGALMVTHDGRSAQLPAPAAVARDTTGAGDTFNGWLAARLAAADGLAAAARLALVAASMSVEHLGARNGMPRTGSWAADVATTDPET